MHRIVGLDVTADALRLVALESGFRGFTVQEARSAPLPPEGTLAERIAAALGVLGASLGDDAVAVALPSAQVASHVVTLPFTDSRRIEQVLPAEVEGAIPFDLGEVVWDHTTLSQVGGKSEVLVAVVKKQLLRETLDALRAAGVEPRVVTFAPMALAALAERGLLVGVPAAGQDAQSAEPGEPVLLLEAGPDRANLTLFRGGQAELARSLGTAPAAAWEAAATDPEALRRLVGPLARDLKITLRTRAARGGRPSPQPARMLLAGSIARLPGAAELLAAETLMQTGPLELLPGAIALPPDSIPAHDLAVALGLALRAQQPRGRLNFRKGAFAFTKDLSQVRGQLVRVVVAASVLLVLALGLGVARVASLTRQTSDYDDALCTATKKVLGTCMTDYRQAVSQLSGGKSKAAGIPRVSAAEVLAEVIAHLPEASMPLLEDVEITTSSVRIKGVAESFAKVDEIISALKTDKCFGEIKQPRTEKQRDSQKVGFAFDFPYTCSGETPGGA